MTHGLTDVANVIMWGGPRSDGPRSTLGLQTSIFLGGAVGLLNQINLFCSEASGDQYLLLFCDDSGGRELKDEYGLYDGMTPKCAIITAKGMTIAMFFTKPPTRGQRDQEIHLLKLRTVPSELASVYHGRN